MTTPVPPETPAPGGIRGPLLGLVLVAAVAGVAALTMHMKKGHVISSQATLPAAMLDRQYEELQQVPEELLKWRRIAQVPTGMGQPRGLAIGPGGNLYVAGDRIIRRFDARGNPSGDIPLDAAPQALAVDADGALFVALRDRVLPVGPDGKVTARWDTPAGTPHLTSVTLTASEVWVGDAGNRVVLRYDRAGRLLGRAGAADPAANAPGLVMPSPHLDVEPTRDGNMMVNNPGRLRVETHDADGNLLTYWGEASVEIEGFSGCCNPTDIALLPDGSGVTSEKGLPRIKVYRPDGALASVVAPPAELSATAPGLDLATDSEGRVFALDPVAGVVLVYERAE